MSPATPLWQSKCRCSPPSARGALAEGDEDLDEPAEDEDGGDAAGEDGGDAAGEDGGDVAVKPAPCG
jgi:hypothetical protein